ncbi:hypothetical protein SUGI_0193670 [Cryptomeria japonica]|uniref:E3 ubiquitin-protein ligase HAKAI homolog n=1 Tax=Cryptomeria japonica TaxID=3369 RepID=UPI002408D176|nr:E3 ubiquitin-protein ligase HAKAI homolog [Cryptomeria japonica]GLJ12572.1 hypothetical protein SUGI_0193670 [Cryptomeria japonica]
MLQIRLNRGNGSEEGGGGRAPSTDNVTVSCPDHLVLADLLVAKGLGLSSLSNVKLLKTVGRKRRRRPGDKIHICLCCDFPIAIYGRLSPCEHAFCLTCARSEPSCYLCDERIQKIQTIKMHDGVFICGAPHCWRSFLKRPDFEQHLKGAHLDLLQTVVQNEDVHQKDNKSIFPDTQNKQPHAESQELSRSISAPLLQASQQSPLMLPKQKGFLVTTATSLPEKQLQDMQSTGLAVSPASSLPEKSPQFIQPRGLPLSQAVSPLEKQSQQNQSQGSILGGRCHDQQQSEHCNNQVNASAVSQQQNQVCEKHPSQSLQDNYQGQSQGEIHQMHSEMGKQYSQQQENQQTDGFHQYNLPYQTLLQRPPPPPPANPPFLNYSFSNSYPIPLGGQLQQSNPHFDPRFGPAMNGATFQATMQENNQKIPMQTPVFPQTQDYCHIGHVTGISVLAHEGASTIPAPKEGYMHQDRVVPFSHVQSDLGQVLPGMPLQLPPQGTDMGFDPSMHYQDGSHAPGMPPLPKHTNYQNNPVQAEVAVDYGLNGGITNFGGHGYVSWPSPQSHA